MSNFPFASVKNAKNNVNNRTAKGIEDQKNEGSRIWKEEIVNTNNPSLIGNDIVPYPMYSRKRKKKKAKIEKINEYFIFLYRKSDKFSGYSVKRNPSKKEDKAMR